MSFAVKAHERGEGSKLQIQCEHSFSKHAANLPSPLAGEGGMRSIPGEGECRISRNSLSACRQSLFQIGDDVVLVFQPDG
jgi:hypothetical protein